MNFVKMKMKNFLKYLYFFGWNLLFLFKFKVNYKTNNMIQSSSKKQFRFSKVGLGLSGLSL